MTSQETKIKKLISTGKLKVSCSENFLFSCDACGEYFSSNDWKGNGNDCPACAEGKMGSSPVCSRCRVTFQGINSTQESGTHECASIQVFKDTGKCVFDPSGASDGWEEIPVAPESEVKPTSSPRSVIPRVSPLTPPPLPSSTGVRTTTTPSTSPPPLVIPTATPPPIIFSPHVSITVPPPISTSVAPVVTPILRSSKSKWGLLLLFGLLLGVFGAYYCYNAIQKIIYHKQLSAKQYMESVQDAEIKQFVSKEYPSNYTTQKYIYDEQLSAKQYMESVQDAEVKQFVSKKYPSDYSTQKYIYDNKMGKR